MVHDKQADPRPIAEWVVQLTWFAAGSFAVGAFWYCLAQGDLATTVAAGVGSVLLAGLAVVIHRRNDGLKTLGDRRPEDSPIVLRVGEETIHFTELHRSLAFDVVKVHAHTHLLGIRAEYEWLKRRYPGYDRVSQGVTTLDLLKGGQKYSRDQVHFDLLAIRLADGRDKEVYFDISDFYGGPASHLDPQGLVSTTLSKLYDKGTLPPPQKEL